MAPRPAPAPSVLVWYRTYCGIMAFLYLVTLAVGAGVLLSPADWGDQETPAEQRLFVGLFLAGLGSVLSAVFLAAFFLPRQPWAWVYHLVLIVLGMSSCWCLPICIPLLLGWIRTETRAYFGWEPQQVEGPYA
jgi:hypothetical protein